METEDDSDDDYEEDGDEDEIEKIMVLGEIDQQKLRHQLLFGTFLFILYLHLFLSFLLTFHIFSSRIFFIFA